MSRKTPRGAERRGYPRINVSVPVALTHESGVQVEGRTADVAARGMQVRCDRQAAAHLFPAGGRVDDADSARIGAVLSLPLREGLVRVGIRCQVVHLSLVAGVGADREAAIGMLFERFAGDGARAYERFVSESLVPAGEG